ncbi:SusC/RagA family TonB-linked outer membrane protein [Ochrovirga pacifica]|uniref:SusC/RagA family TonB-linked outer membrane protein n=1 Tax=Ochrovirga pacifica TaxID=1042376 RepID=UPI0002559FD6|nr:SusC/RagA family TonB-linked outer membrane protein [Ochrovirga pacifica]
MKINLTRIPFNQKKGGLACMLFVLVTLFYTSVQGASYSPTISPTLYQTTKIYIEKDQTISVDEVFKIIKTQTQDFMFIYREDLFVNTPKVTLKKGSYTLDDLLSISLPKDKYSITITENNTIVIKEKKKTLQQPKRVMGKVMDVSGNPLPSVSVVVKQEAIGTSTDANGNYRILVPSSESILIFSSLGFATQEIMVGNQSTVDVKLEPSLNELDEVVISTGIFKRKAGNYTGATTTVSKEQLKRVGNANLFQTLKNIDPSIAIFDSFELGSDPNALPDVQIRGASSFPVENNELSASLRGNYLKSPNQPLFILNGFESTIEQILDLDINFIESVTILKDAASKAIYGSKAANGVVVIETQKLSKEKVRITYNANVDLEIPDLTSYNLTNALEKIEAERIDGVYLPTVFSDADDLVRLEQLYNYRKKLALEGLDTDWISKPLQTGIGQRHSLSVELGGNALRMLANLSYNDVAGVMKGSGRKILSGNVNTFYRVKNVSFTNRTFITQNDASESPYGTFNEYVKMNPYWQAVNPDGSIPYYAEIAPDGTRYTNPLYNTTINTKATSSYLNFLNNLYVQWDILPELRATTRIGIDVKHSDADIFLPSDHTSFDAYVSDEDLQRKGSYQVNDGNSKRVSGDFNLMYNKTFGKHTYFSNVGFNISEQKYQEIIHKVEGFPSGRNHITFGRDYVLGTRPSGIEGVSRDVGFLAVGSYVYDNRFLSDITLRTNASSQFGENNRWANFWSLGLGWNLHNESFLKQNWLDVFRLRGSIGSTGNQNFNSNASIATYSYYLDNLYQGFSGSYLNNLANPNLQWEAKMDYNAGLDLQLKGLTLKFDVYQSITENLITDLTVPTSTGFNSVKENIGRVKNSGIEINASYLVWSNNTSFLSLNFGIQTNKNEIVELSDALTTANDLAKERAADRGNNQPVLIYEDGRSLNAIWAVPSLGIDPATGNEIYVDKDGNTTFEWSADDMVVAGNSNPKYRGVLGLNGEYKGFGFGITGRFLGGGQLYNQTLVDRVENVDINYNVDKRVLTGRWLTPGQEALYKRLGDYNRSNGDGTVTAYQELTRATTRFVQDRNELDISSINLYYNFQDKWIESMGLDRLKLSFNMNEVAKFSSIEIERGTSYPFARTLSFSLSATF